MEVYIKHGFIKGHYYNIAINERGGLVAISPPSKRLVAFNELLINRMGRVNVKLNAVPYRLEPLIKNVIIKLMRAYMGEAVTFNEELFLDYLPPFTIKVLKLVLKIPRGKVASYGEVANKLGSIKLSRAVGNALNLNPLPIIIPCHRVVRGDGGIGGFKYDIKLKERLLAGEGVYVCGGFIPKRFFHHFNPS